MLTGVSSHASMSTESRLAELEKLVPCLFKITKEQADYIDELREAFTQLHSEFGTASESVGEIEEKLDTIISHISGEPKSS